MGSRSGRSLTETRWHGRETGHSWVVARSGDRPQRGVLARAGLTETRWRGRETGHSWVVARSGDRPQRGVTGPMGKPLLVRDVMTIGVPVCHDRESCGEVAARLARDAGGATAIVVLDRDGSACGWLTRDRLARRDEALLVGEAMDEDIPTVPPDIPAAAAAQLMRDRGVEHLFLMHTWPGEPRPSAVISLRTIEKRVKRDT